MLVRPLLLYCSQVWSPHRDYLISKLESVQHKFLRHLSFRIGCPMSYYQHDYSEIAVKFGICSIRSLHYYYDILLVKKVLFIGNVHNNLLSKLFVTRDLTYNFRNARNFKESETKKDYILHSVVFRLRRRWNTLGYDLKSRMKFNRFKSILSNISFEYC